MATYIAKLLRWLAAEHRFDLAERAHYQAPALNQHAFAHSMGEQRFNNFRSSGGGFSHPAGGFAHSGGGHR